MPLDSSLEQRIRDWTTKNLNHPGKPPRETSVDWLAALLHEIDRLRANQKDP